MEMVFFSEFSYTKLINFETLQVNAGGLGIVREFSTQSMDFKASGALVHL